jgi:hypothetical protein
MAKVHRREKQNGRRAIAADTALSSRTFARLAIAALVLGCAALGTRPALAQDDDWSVVPSQQSNQDSNQAESQQVHPSHPSKAKPAEADSDTSQALPQELQPGADGAQMICGEMAWPAAEPYKSIVADIDRQWGTNAPVYESVRADSPHVSRAGCIFYNPTFMEVFLRGETDEHGEPDKTSMIYAIMAHELGHIEHHDYERTDVSSVDKELEADRFSGYTLSRMGISRGNITPFYSLGGDEFSGVHDHGFSNERLAAFNKGWKEAEWGQPEDGGRGAAKNAASNSTSDDSSDDSSTAAVP